jgi:histidine triad (HIT) family protein
MHRTAAEAPCLFCRIVRRELPTPLLYEDEAAVAFADIAPQAPVHVLFVPKTHTPTHLQTEETAVLGALLRAVRLWALGEGLSDYRLVINNGAQAGQSVFHLHVHLLAGRPLQWPPG